jgi:hypothetical protein
MFSSSVAAAGVAAAEVELAACRKPFPTPSPLVLT